jgi:hypothetical protein
MSSLVETKEFNQDAINAEIDQIKKDCEEKGEEYAKSKFQEFGG